MMGKTPKSTDPQETEGWESLAESDEGMLAPNPELEEALREAAEAVDGGSTKEDAEPDDEGLSESRELSQLRDQMLRLQADFENLRRRTLREKEEAFRYGHENLIKDLLPSVDNLERAIDHVRKSEGEDREGLLQGVELVLRELQGVFENHGVTLIEADGVAFDPEVHEAMAQVPDDSVPANTVVQVYQKGYRLRDHLLRPSRVVVSRASEQKTEAEGSGEGAAGEG